MNKEAQYYNIFDDKKVQCILCPHQCILNLNERGKCRVRKNDNGKLISENYSIISAIHTDPVEKKPLYHFYPGNDVLSIGSIGCNLKCKHCQNSSISQTQVADYVYSKSLSSDYIINEAKRIKQNIGIAYTYNEPTVWFEYMFETAKKATKHDMKNIVVSNGYINRKPLEDLCHYIDAFNIDLKAFTNEFYIKQTQSSINPILKSIETIFKYNIHLEITTLIIPGLNDNVYDFEKMIKMLSNNFGKDIVLHLSKYYPAYQSKIEATSKKTIMELFALAKQYLHYVYLGNLITDQGQNTYCPNCGEILVLRNRYISKISHLENNKCTKCNTIIPIYL